ncbi:MAG TPA: rubredoxin [Ramlibacter sp.]|nr:rubredoxin [Ramlibacter sp.]
MALVRSLSEVRRLRRDFAGGFLGFSSHFIQVPEDPAVDSPMAFLAEGDPGQGLRTHFHQVDQFQLVYAGSGTLGQHRLAPGGIHFARAYTPYGPLRNGEQDGLAYMTLRAHRDPGARYLPEQRAQLEAVADRAPWQVTCAADFNLQPDATGVAFKPVPGLQDNAGLGAWSFRLAPGAKTRAPDASGGEGQYILVLEGSLRHGDAAKQGLAIVWVAPHEDPFELVAGPDGMEGLVLNFPRARTARPEPAATPAEALRVWMCVLCGFVYEETAGAPEHGIPPGTRWADVPESFGCPDCSALKADFEMVEV